MNTMSLTPSTPSSITQDLKSFWSRPEGKTGMIFIALAAGALVYGWAQIVPFIVSMLADTLHMVLLAGILAAVLFIVFSSRTHLLFRLVMRAITGLIINIDPIGILKDHLSQMRKRREVMAQQISNVSGQIQYLKSTIDKNAAMANENMRLAAHAKKLATSAADQNEQLRMALQMKAKANQAGRLQKSNLSYQQLLNKLQNIYELLSKWAVHIDFYIEDTDNEVKQAEIEYKTINAAYRAYRTALSVIKGTGDEKELYNQTMEKLAEEAGRKLGEMEDFQRLAQNFMDTIDLENGAVETDALEKLDAYEQKLLTNGASETPFLLPGATSAPAPVPATKGGDTLTPAKSASDYGDMFK
jgi:predicted  nucleic acid-binding Zn-ribbon protein